MWTSLQCGFSPWVSKILIVSTGPMRHGCFAWVKENLILWDGAMFALCFCGWNMSLRASLRPFCSGLNFIHCRRKRLVLLTSNSCPIQCLRMVNPMKPMPYPQFHQIFCRTTSRRPSLSHGRYHSPQLKWRHIRNLQKVCCDRFHPYIPCFGFHIWENSYHITCCIILARSLLNFHLFFPRERMTGKPTNEATRFFCFFPGRIKEEQSQYTEKETNLWSKS